jgi:Lrp/AsnC family transcriptional regulator for asnA, asnC and gidA
MARLDELDMKILSTLYKDASISIPDLSKQLGINLSVAYSRIKRLRRRGVIDRYTLIVNEEKLGYNSSAIAGLNLDPKLREQAINEVMNLENVRLVSEVTGRFDVLVYLKGRSLDEIHSIVYEKIGKIAGVTHTEVFVEVTRKYPNVTFKLLRIDESS